MPYQNREVRRGSWTPVAVGSAETKTLMTLKKGWRVVSGSVRCRVPAAGATTSTVSLGVTGTVTGILAATDTEQAVGALVNGQGALLNQANGYLATADISVVLDYVIGATPGATVPVFDYVLVIEKEWPTG